MKATTYHIRSMDGTKLVGGTIGMGMPIDLNAAADRLLEEVELGITNSGRVTFMKDGRPVYVYLSVDPGETAKGKALLRAHNEAMAIRQAEAEAKEAARSEQLQSMIDSLGGVENAIAALAKVMP